MAEFKNGRIIAMVEHSRNRHRVNYNLKCHGLAEIHRTFSRFEYNCPCPIMPSAWRIELGCKPVQKRSCSCNFSINLTRMDNSANDVNVTLFVSFYDDVYEPVVNPLFCARNRMRSHDELEGMVRNIYSINASWVDTVYVIIQIEHCQAETNLQCVSKAITNEKCID